MGKSILREMALGNVNPSEGPFKQTPEYRNALKILMETEQKLMALLTDDDMAVYEEFNTAHMNFSVMENSMKYTQGYITGAAMILEVMLGKDSLYYE